MKDIKSFIIGFLSCACFLLIMGQTDEENFTMSVLDGDITISDEFGQYQAFASNDAVGMIDTQTGEFYLLSDKGKLNKTHWLKAKNTNVSNAIIIK